MALTQEQRDELRKKYFSGSLRRTNPTENNDEVNKRLSDLGIGTRKKQTISEQDQRISDLEFQVLGKQREQKDELPSVGTGVLSKLDQFAEGAGKGIFSTLTGS